MRPDGVRGQVLTGIPRQLYITGSNAFSDTAASSHVREGAVCRYLDRIDIQRLYLQHLSASRDNEENAQITHWFWSEIRVATSQPAAAVSYGHHIDIGCRQIFADAPLCLLDRALAGDSPPSRRRRRPVGPMPGDCGQLPVSDKGILILLITILSLHAVR